MASTKQWGIAVVILGIGPLSALAQQSMAPRPIVLYRPAPASSQAMRRPVTLTTKPASTPTANVNGTRSTAGNQSLGQGNAATQQPQSSTSGSDPQAQDADNNQPKTPEQEWLEEQKRPTSQMLQNPSAAWNLTHTGISNSQQMAPNTYLGNQFQSWTNQQSVPQMPANFGEMNRFQPGPSGAYMAPNTYMGTGFYSWNNLTQGGISPGATGSWGFSVWP